MKKDNKKNSTINPLNRRSFIKRVSGIIGLLAINPSEVFGNTLPQSDTLKRKVREVQKLVYRNKDNVRRGISSTVYEKTVPFDNTEVKIFYSENDPDWNIMGVSGIYIRKMPTKDHDGFDIKDGGADGLGIKFRDLVKNTKFNGSLKPMIVKEYDIKKLAYKDIFELNKQYESFLDKMLISGGLKKVNSTSTIDKIIQ